MRLFRYALAVLLLGICCCVSPRNGMSTDLAGPPHETAAYGSPLRIGKLQTAELVETSGLVASRQTAGLLWAINDSGNLPEIFALGSGGEDRGRVRITGVGNIDWEDLAAFTLDGKAYLLVADVGDNRSLREEVLLHVVPEPLPGKDGRFAGTIAPTRSLRLRFEDGPRDCEGVAVDERDGQILLLSKRTEPPVLYCVPLHPTDPGRIQTARRVAGIDRIPAPAAADLAQPYGRFRSWPTALDLRFDGAAMVVLTYKDAYLYRRNGNESWTIALTRPPEVLPLPDTEQLPQREAMCFDPDGALLVTSEGPGAALFRLAPGRAEDLLR